MDGQIVSRDVGVGERNAVKEGKVEEEEEEEGKVKE